MSKNNSGKWLGGVFFGIVVGAVSGLLLAPHSGKETREKLKIELDKLKAEIEKYTNDFSEKARKAKEVLEARLQETQEKLNGYEE